MTFSSHFCDILGLLITQNDVKHQVMYVFLDFQQKTAILPPEMLFIDLTLPNRHLEYLEATAYDLLLTFFSIF